MKRIGVYSIIALTPQGFVEEKRYCGYRPEKVGCQRSED